MSDPLIDLSHALFAKTAVGQQEIQTRALRLSPITRRLLILIDGKRPAQELSPLVAGHDLNELLNELLAKGCVEAIAKQPAAPSAVVAAPLTPAASPGSAPSAPHTTKLADLPEASSRSTKEVDMARHFMMNTINTVFQQNTRLTLMEAIFACKTADDVRRVYPRWLETMSASAIGTRRLPEFHEKLFQVL
ncbi:MAG: hypothetical protein PHQ58_03400 [Rhodoferax sp.]|uniref:hypothetical protein n=1 Tax=Rhodoferax sp. TaxID=50421 RepID=UPI00261A3F9F|nr:hypothetical protein [Rhodoferax sp.]MDD2879458.1 hypothetical protein [Rhodoferax sp.]